MPLDTKQSDQHDRELWWAGNWCGINHWSASEHATIKTPNALGGNSGYLDCQFVLYMLAGYAEADLDSRFKRRSDE